MRRILVVLVFASAHALAAVDTAETAAAIVERSNALRAEQSLPRVQANPALQAAAQAFARHMAKTGEHSHTADGRTPVQRAVAAGYDFCIVTENIGYHASTREPTAVALAERMMRGWKDSPGHRKNLVDASVTDIGVGVAPDERGRYFAVQMFGRPKSAAIRFSVVNPTTEEVQYRVGTQAYVSPPRVERTHEICRPAEVRIGTAARQARDGARYVIGQEP